MKIDNFTILIHPNAEKEFIDSVEWYELLRKNLGVEFSSEIEKVLLLIEHNPFIFSIKNKVFREAVVKKFPYLIVFTINKINKTIYVISIFNTTRNPKLKYILKP